MMTVKTHALELAKNGFGDPLSPDIRRRIKRFLANPTVETWNDIYSIIISPKKLTTIWQAVLIIKPDFPQTARFEEDLQGNIIRHWSAIPTPLEVMRAIREVTN